MEVFEKLVALNILVFLLVCQHRVIGAPQLDPTNGGSRKFAQLYPQVQKFVDRGEELEAQASHYQQRTVHHYYYSPRRRSKVLPYFLVGLAAGSAAVLGGAIAAGTGKK